MENKTNRGGRREGSGRKPIKDKKQVVSAYVLSSHVIALGGAKVVKAIAEQAIERRAKIVLK